MTTREEFMKRSICKGMMVHEEGLEWIFVPLRRLKECECEDKAVVGMKKM